jgi:hypothetical protein
VMTKGLSYQPPSHKFLLEVEGTNSFDDTSYLNPCNLDYDRPVHTKRPQHMNLKSYCRDVHIHDKPGIQRCVRVNNLHYSCHIHQAPALVSSPNKIAKLSCSHKIVNHYRKLYNMASQPSEIPSNCRLKQCGLQTTVLAPTLSGSV